jgi:hypothetical protein
MSCAARIWSTPGGSWLRTSSRTWVTSSLSVAPGSISDERTKRAVTSRRKASLKVPTPCLVSWVDAAVGIRTGNRGSPAGNLRRAVARQPSAPVSRTGGSFREPSGTCDRCGGGCCGCCGRRRGGTRLCRAGRAIAAEARTALASPQQLEARLLRTYDAFDANQGVAVDRSHFYAVDNTSITKHSRETGAPVLQFAGADGGPLIHLDSGAVHRGRLYAAHSNYSESPMESSVEVFDAGTLEHVESHSFEIDRGSLTGSTALPTARGGRASPTTTGSSTARCTGTRTTRRS